jgi:uncharacterized protein (TIGR00251 family)
VSRDSTWLRHDPASGRVVVTLHVQPGARKNEITGLHGDALKVKIAAPAVENKANSALIEFLAGTLGVPKSAVAIRQGATGRRKVVEIAGGPALAAKLDAFVGS